MNKKLTALIILDGWGLEPKESNNAIALAKTPNFDKLIKEYPTTTLSASGLDVGLPEGQMGNSEVGHLNIGAGRIVHQELTRITKAIEEKSFYHNQVLLEAVDKAKKEDKSLHIMGLLSDGGVHSHNTHLYALLKLAKSRGLNKVFIHCFMDGRDVPPTNGKYYLEELEEKIKEIGVGKIATIIGRYYAMDRDKRWERTNKAYDALVFGKGIKENLPVKAIKNRYNEGETDEFISPIVIMDNKKPISTIEKNDSIIFYNFRPDRARQITKAFVNEKFEGFNREKGYFAVNFYCMTRYDKEIKNIKIAFEPERLDNILGEVLSKEGINQLRITETEKYAHVTFFFNGGEEEPYKNENRILIPSPKVSTYDKKPEMSAFEVADRLIEELDNKSYDFLVLNFANPDMVGHTGELDAAIKAVESVDKCLGKVIEKILSLNGRGIITADHGNAEKMKAENGDIHTAHTSNKVPLILFGKEEKELIIRAGRLCDIAPTILDIFGIEKPEDMTGITLIQRS